MSLQYCGHCRDYHPPEDGYYWGPTYDCYKGEEPAEAALSLAKKLDKKLSKLENTVWAIAKAVGVNPEDV